MTKLTDIIAWIISLVCYPLFIPTYGIALFCYFYAMHVHPLPVVWMLIAIFGTLLLTCVLPLSAIGILILRGKVKNFQIKDANERTLPYVYASLGFGFWSYLMIAILKAPLFIGYVCIGATVAIGLVTIINQWWKISAHLTGIGGLFGGLMSYCIGVGAIPTWTTLGIWLAGSLIVMYARLRLNAHTDAQVSAGWLLGFSCTCLPMCILSYAA